MDNFLSASSINVFERVEKEADPRKFAFVSKGMDLRNAYCEEVVAVVSLCRQFEDALAALLDSQRKVRAVTADEHVIKATWMHERFARLLESLLDKTRKQFVSLQKNFLSVYPEKAAARGVRLQAGPRMDEEVNRAERTRNPNVAAKKAAVSAKRRPVEELDDADTWLETCVPAGVKTVPGPNEARPAGLASAAPASTARAAQRKKSESKKSESKKSAEQRRGHRSRSESPSFPSSEDGSSEVVDVLCVEPPSMVAVKKLRVEEPATKQAAQIEPMQTTDWTFMGSCNAELDAVEDMCLGPLGMVFFDEVLIPEGIF